MSGRFDVYQDAAGGWRWRLVARNGRILASGESHTRERDAWRAVDTVAETAPKARRWRHKVPKPGVKAVKR